MGAGRGKSKPIMKSLTRGRKYFLPPVFCCELLYQRWREKTRGKGFYQTNGALCFRSSAMILCTSCQPRAFHPRKSVRRASTGTTGSEAKKRLSVEAAGKRVRPNNAMETAANGCTA